MKLEVSNPNYCATVIRINNLNKLNGLDNLLGVNIFGFQGLVSKDHNVGELGLWFTAETQLSPDYCKNNNLYRHSELNLDTEKVGYIEDKGRIKALKLRGNTSSALFMPLSSLSYLGIDVNEFKEGDTFTHINGVEVCKKYIVQNRMQSQAQNKTKGKNKVFCRVDALMFPEHFDTDNYWKNVHNISGYDDIIVTQKLHGTSARFANTIVKRQLTWKEKIAKFFGCKVEEYEYDVLAASRRVVKDLKGRVNHDHYYEEDLWNHHLNKIKHCIPPGFIIYGEIIGWVGNSEIQKNYTYSVPQGESRLYIYRISTINKMGYVVDLSWDQVVEFCKNNGLLYVPEIWRGPHVCFCVDQYMDIKYKESGYENCVGLSANSPCDEGVCIRVDGLKPYILKAKCPTFFEHETKMYDKGISDIETEESVQEQLIKE